MALDINITGNGTTLYLVNSGGAATAGGAATGISTTPFMIYDDGWTVTAPSSVPIWSGGPPFRNGSAFVQRDYQNVTETFTLMLFGSTHDTTAARLRQLYQTLNTAQNLIPCVMAVTPNGSTNKMYTEIYSADVQPTSQILNPTGGFSVITIHVTITRAPFFSLLSSGETLINAQTYTVAGNAAALPSNNTAYGSGAGDFIYEGSPLNIKVTPTTAASDIGELWCASTWAYANLTSGSTLNVYGVGAAVTAVWTPTTALAHNGSKLRVIARVTNATGGAVSKYFLYIRGSLTTGTAFLWSSPVNGVSPTTESTGLVDFGPIPVDFLRTISPLTGTIALDFYATKTAGTCTLISVELLIYSDLCKIAGVLATQASGRYLWLNGFRAKSNQVCLPTSTSASNLTSGDGLYTPCVLRGQLPRYFSGASLWANWLDSTGNNTSASTRAASVTATHGPLWFTMRGAG